MREVPVHVYTVSPTVKQVEALEFIANSLREHFYSPSWREIGNHIGVTSTNAVHNRLLGLERKGLLRRVEMQPRGLVPTDAGYELLGWTRCDCGAWRPG